IWPCAIDLGCRRTYLSPDALATAGLTCWRGFMAIDVTVTERAARKIGEILGREPSGTMLRVSVQGGGCSGFQYKFDTERAKADDDVVIERAGAPEPSDPGSLDHLAGSA